MAFRRQSSNPNPYPFAGQGGGPQQQQQQSQSPIDDANASQGAASNSRKRPRDPSDVGDGPAPPNDPFQHENGSDASEGSDDGGGGKPDKKAGRRKIKIEFIQDKSRRHITFSKRKAGIMKKAYELSTLTGTQVLLLVVSETGLVYTFTTAKLQPLVTQPEGKNLIQACLNAPHGAMPSSMPVGAPLGRPAPGGMGGGPGPTPGRSNVPGGLAIGAGDKDTDPDAPGDEDHAAARDDPTDGGPTRPSSSSHHQRRPSNASDVPGAEKSPTQGPRKPPSPPRGGIGGMPQPPTAHYANPYPLQNVGLDPSIYAHHAGHYMPGQAGTAGPGGSYAMGAGAPPPGGQGNHWNTAGQAGYRR